MKVIAFILWMIVVSYLMYLIVVFWFVGDDVAMWLSILGLTGLIAGMYYKGMDGGQNE